MFGNWTNSSICMIKDCGHIHVPKNGSTILSNKTSTYGSIATFACDRGFDLSKNETIECLSSGNWSQSTVSCILRDCGKLDEVNHGKVRYNETTYQANAVYKCNVGYSLNGRSSRTCQVNGNWSGTQPKCALIVCPEPVNIPNGNYHLEYFHPLLTFNHTVTYGCNHGYEIAAGNTTILRCTEHSNWSDDAPTCIDIDECTRKGYSQCHWDAYCNNTIGSYNCTCKEGYTPRKNGFICDDYDECAKKEDNCTRNESQTRDCLNEMGGYYCLCHHGWTGTYCEIDIDECENNNTCGENAFCSNYRGGYNCTCNKSYPSGDPRRHCFENIIIELETKGQFHQGNNEILDAIHIHNRLPYFGVEYQYFRPYLNGFISLGYQQLYDRHGEQTPEGWKNRTFGLSVVAPMWTNLDTTQISGGLYVNLFQRYTGYGRNDTEHRDLDKLGNATAQCYNLTDFKPRIAIVTTWKNVTQWGSLPPSILIWRENATMQGIIISDGVYSYVMFNYDRAQWSLKNHSYSLNAAGFSLEDKTGYIIADSSNYTLLNKGTNCGLKGRWIFNVTKDDAKTSHNFKEEAACLEFHENQTIRDWVRKKMALSYACPCDEFIMKLDYTYTTVPPINDKYGSQYKTICYEAWFQNSDGIKQKCCYRLGALLKRGVDGGGTAIFVPDPYNISGSYYLCCFGDRHLCDLYYDVVPPDDCSRWTPDDEAPIQRVKRSVMSYLPFGGNGAWSAHVSKTGSILLNILLMIVHIVYHQSN